MKIKSDSRWWTKSSTLKLVIQAERRIVVDDLKMGKSYTIFAAQFDRAAVLSVLRQIPEAHVVDRNGQDEWNSFLFIHVSVEIEFNTMFRLVPRDQGSHIILGMHNWVRNAKASSEALRATVADHVIKSRALIGIGTSIDVFPSSAEFTFIKTVAKAMAGVIFTGTMMLDSDGNVLLPS